MNTDRYILGISAFYHDSAAALIKDGVIVSAAQQERFSRIKNDFGFPGDAIEWILKENRITLANIEAVVFYEKPFVKFERILATCIRFAPKGFKIFRQAIPTWLKDKLFQKHTLIESLKELSGGEAWNEKLLFSEHHLSHSAASFYPSPFHEAAILTIDGVGEKATTTISVGKGCEITRIKEINFPHSYGLLYSTLTAFLGFRVNSGEYKVMGLAPYGKPIFADKIRENLLDLRDDGSFRLNMRYFRFATELKMHGTELEQLFGVPARKPESNIEQAYKDIAASLQAVTDEILLKLSKHTKEITNQKYLCLGGGVSLNCAATGNLLRSGLFEDIWIQPSAGDAGSASGAALLYYHKGLEQQRKPTSRYNPFLGPSFTTDQVEIALKKMNAVYEVMPMELLLRKTAKAISKGKIIGWMQGGAEYSPRALGNRSILADPRIPDLKKKLNLKIKFRESFRPFAPSVMEEYASGLFEVDRPSPFMNFVCKAKPTVNQFLPSIVHVDSTARLQTVSESDNSKFYNLLSCFYQITKCPVLVNTSFNIRGEPVVLTPHDAFNCFMNTGIDCLIIENVFLEKEKQPTNIHYIKKSDFLPD